MAQIINRNKALAVSPLKASQTMGAALAFLGLARSMPLLHGSQGCTAFAKVFFVRHFREPVPLQTTAMDQVSSVMGADENVVEALRTICDKQHPAVVGLLSTALAETQGCDLHSAVHQFRREYPEYGDVAVVSVNSPDFSGCFESGFAAALKAMIEALVPERRDQVGQRPRQVNVLCSASLTPGDLEFVAESIESFGLRPLLIPDLSGSLDGHLDEAAFNPLTTGGLTLDELASAGQSAAPPGDRPEPGRRRRCAGRPQRRTGPAFRPAAGHGGGGCLADGAERDQRQPGAGALAAPAPATAGRHARYPFHARRRAPGDRRRSRPIARFRHPGARHGRATGGRGGAGARAGAGRRAAGAHPGR